MADLDLVNDHSGVDFLARDQDTLAAALGDEFDAQLATAKNVQPSSAADIINDGDFNSEPSK